MIITDEWFVGFVDGEGSLNIAGHGGVLQPRFRLNQRDDDGDLVRAIHAWLGVGSIRAKQRAPLPVNANPQVALSVVGKDCATLVEIFDRCPLRSKKRFEYPLWREAIEVYIRHRGHRWFAPKAVALRTPLLVDLRDRLSTVRAYGGAR